jgi:hypothetical protein
MEGNAINHELVQRLKDHERMIEQELRNYPHRMALREAERTRQAAYPTLTARVGAWLHDRLPGVPSPAKVNVNLNIAVVYVGADPGEPTGELVYGGERIEWNQFIDAIKAAVQSKLNASRAREYEGDQPVIVYVR